MRRLLQMLAAVCVAAAPLALTAQTQPPQTARTQGGIQLFMPKTVYLGDTAELRYIFRSERDLFALADGAAKANDSISLDAETVAASLSPDGSIYVKNASLERLASEYTLTVTLVPWRAGTLSFAPIDVERLVRSEQHRQDESVSEPVVLAPVTIHSRASELHETELRPPAAPLVLPGTTAVLLVLAACAVLVLSALVVLVCKLPALSSLLAAVNATRFARRQAAAAIRKLRRIQRLSVRGSLEMRAFCSEVQHIMRGFLEKRFSRPFDALATPSLYATFVDIAGGQLNEEQEKAVQALVCLFARTDYLRFAHEGVGWTSDSAATLTDRACECVLALASDPAAQGDRHDSV